MLQFQNEKNPYIELGKALFGFSQHTKNAILMGIFKDTKGFLYESRLDYYRERAAKLQTAFEVCVKNNNCFTIFVQKFTKRAKIICKKYQTFGKYWKKLLQRHK